jgi:hypothetical protein
MLSQQAKPGLIMIEINPSPVISNMAEFASPALNPIVHLSAMVVPMTSLTRQIGEPELGISQTVSSLDLLVTLVAGNCQVASGKWKTGLLMLFPSIVGRNKPRKAVARFARAAIRPGGKLPLMFILMTIAAAFVLQRRR